MFTDKYELLGTLLKNDTGILVDIGARDCRLKKYLPNLIEYRSADRTPGFDYCWDLEKPIPVDDQSVDFVVGLDVLEHVDHFHQGLFEILRIVKKKAFISLPNMSCLSQRIQFVISGTFGEKYTLHWEKDKDRHRWLTVYHQFCDVIPSVAKSRGFWVARYDVLKGYSRFHNLIARFPFPSSLTSHTVLFEIGRSNLSHDSTR